MVALLTDLLKARAPEPAWRWCDESLRALDAPADRTRLLAVYTGMARRLGTAPLALTDAERARLRDADPALSLERWGPHDIGRALLLIAIAETQGPDTFAALALDCYENGDASEQQSWLRALAVLPHPDRFVTAAVSSCRTHVQPLFEAIACENPYPCRHFPDLNFDQMVLKSLFLGIRLARIVGLESRLNPELSRMADDYVSEREAAGRTVPPDIWLAVAPRAARDRLARVRQYLAHEDPEHRYWAAVGLGWVRDPDCRAALERQRAAETDPRLVAAMDAALARMAG